jgi:hypothetical protein
LLKHCTRGRKVTVSIPFQPHYGPGFDSPSNRNEYQGYLLEGRGGRCVELTTLPLLYADYPEIVVASKSLSAKGLSRPVMGLLYLYFTLLQNFVPGLDDFQFKFPKYVVHFNYETYFLRIFIIVGHEVLQC